MITAKRLREVVSYNPETGVFAWAMTRRKCAIGAVPGHVRSCDGYVSIYIDGANYLAHRLAWLYVTGRWPKNQIDHKDGNRVNNRFQNLRDVIQNLNTQNQRRPRRNNKTGFLGVSFDKSRGKYVSGITTNNKQRCLGRFNTAIEAHNAYLTAKRAEHAGNMI